jgi:hypothetical protein
MASLEGENAIPETEPVGGEAGFAYFVPNPVDDDQE